MDLQQSQLDQPVIRRKPIPRRPVADQAQNKASAVPRTAPYAAQGAAGRSCSYTASPAPSQFLASRHQTTSTTTSSAGTWASIPESVASTAATSVASFECPPSMPERPRTAAVDGDRKDKDSSFWKTAFDETKFFAGGLIHKPYESTKHYAIVRHTSGLIMYHGPSTSVVVTVFSTAKHELPRDRTVWLQRRGFSGDTGLKLKTLVGASGSWLAVTPEREVQACELPSADERAYQRDIAKILKRGRHGDKALAGRQARETLIVRIPAAANDGYFRLVVCTGGETTATKRKVLCGSPVFRVASTSTDSSIFRGASLRTLPLEAGVKIASVIGTTAVSTWTEPVVAVVQEQWEKYQPSTAQTMAATEMYGQSGLQTQLDQADERYSQQRETAYSTLHGPSAGEEDEDDTPPDVIGADSGPEKPFPISFGGRVVPGTGTGTSSSHGVPTANLAGTPDDVRMRMRGVYFGWAALAPGKGMAAAEDSRVTQDWIEALVTVGPLPWAPKSAAVVARNEVTVHLLYDFGGATFLGAKMQVVVMGYLRAQPATTSSGTAVAAQAYYTNTKEDARVAVTSLSRPHWGPQVTLERMETEKSTRSLSDKCADARDQLQKRVDRLPAHWAGVRTEGGEMRDQLYGNGGLFVRR